MIYKRHCIEVISFNGRQVDFNLKIVIGKILIEFGVRGCKLCILVKENRIYIRVEFTRKKCKTAILLYCFHTAGVLHIVALYNLLGPVTSFYRKSKINI